MKKLIILIAAIALVCFSVPAMAVDWNFYGNARMATFYTSEDIDDNGPIDFTEDEDEDDGLQWSLQGNSRVGANIKAENISARFEFGVNETTVSSRRLYGVWNFGVGKMKVGKDYTPVSQFISGQVYDGDLGLLGVGTVYGDRRGQISFQFGGFEVALIDPEANLLDGMTETDTTTLVITTGTGGTNLPVETKVDATGDVDKILPKIEAGWGMSFDSWNFGLMGGFQYYCIEDVDTDPGTAVDEEDVSVISWVLGGDIGFNFGPGYIKGALSYGQNVGSANWSLPGNRNKTSGTGGFALWDGDDDTNETYTFMGALVGGLKLSDMFSFEAGFGYRNDRTDEGGIENIRDTSPWAVYLQSVIALAPGVYIIPEVGYYDYDNNADGDDAGSLFYIGGKWQINF